MPVQHIQNQSSHLSRHTETRRSVVPANPGNQFQRKWTDEEYQHAVDRVLVDGLTIKHVAEETGIPYETLRKQVHEYTLHNTPPLPEENPGAFMAREVLEALYVAIYKHTNPTAKRAHRDVNVKALKEAGEAVKLWSAILREDKTPKASKAPQSALEALNGGKAA